jgi:hypothetical protein
MITVRTSAQADFAESKDYVEAETMLRKAAELSLIMSISPPVRRDCCTESCA